MYDDDRKPYVEKFPTKDSVYRYLGTMIPKLKQRVEGQNVYLKVTKVNNLDTYLTQKNITRNFRDPNGSAYR